MLMVSSMAIFCLSTIIVEILLFALDVTIDQSRAICTLSGIACAMGGGSLLGCLVLFALDRFFIIFLLKHNIQLRNYILLYEGMFGILVISVLLTLFDSSRSNFTPVNVGNYCFLSFVSSSIADLIPAILAISYLGTSIIVIVGCYITVYMWVRNVRMNVRAFENTRIPILSGILSFEEASVSDVKILGSPSSPPPKQQQQRKAEATSCDTRYTPTDEVEQQVFMMCVLVVIALVVCWSPLLLVFLYKIVGQRLAPEWAEISALYLTSLDFALVTPTILIRFNKEYRRLWFNHVLPVGWRDSQTMRILFGKNNG